MLLKVFRLLEDLFVNLIPIHYRIPVLCKKQNQAHFELGLDVGALAPVGVLGFVVRMAPNSLDSSK